MLCEADLLLLPVTVHSAKGVSCLCEPLDVSEQGEGIRLSAAQ